MAYTIDGKPVSKPWHTVLTHYRRTGGKFTVNSGRRTLAEQWRLYRLYKAGKGNLAAYPNPGAPHINYGRANHAIDVDAVNGGADRMTRWLKSKGVDATRPVSGEPWHIQVPNDQLKRLAASIERKRKADAKPAKPKPRVLGLSKEGARFIAEFEGFRSKPYRDPVGVWTIGYGSTKGVTAKTPAITKAQALSRLRREVEEQYAPAVRVAAKNAGRTLSQKQFDALVSAVYNLGPGVLDSSRSLGSALRARLNWKSKTANALLLYDKAGSPPRALPGLTRRRQAERRVFLGGGYR